MWPERERISRSMSPSEADRALGERVPTEGASGFLHSSRAPSRLSFHITSERKESDHSPRSSGNQTKPQAAEGHVVIVSSAPGPSRLPRPPSSQPVVAASAPAALLRTACQSLQHRPLGFRLRSLPPGLPWAGPPPAADPFRFPPQFPDLHSLQVCG